MESRVIVKAVKSIAIVVLSLIVVSLVAVAVMVLALWLAIRMTAPLPVDASTDVVRVQNSLAVRNSNSSDKQFISYVEDDTDELHTMQPLTYNNQQVTQNSVFLQGSK